MLVRPSFFMKRGESHPKVFRKISYVGILPTLETFSFWSQLNKSNIHCTLSPMSIYIWLLQLVNWKQSFFICEARDEAEETVYDLALQHKMINCKYPRLTRHCLQSKANLLLRYREMCVLCKTRKDAL